MIDMKRSCLERAEIQQVLQGRLPSDQFELAISHLDDCGPCRSVAESIDHESPWLIDSLAGQADPLQVETDCQIALWQVLETPSFTGTDVPLDRTLPQEFLGPYRLIRSLGSGGMAAVYLAEHQRLRRKCAVKILSRDRVDQPGWLERFDREMTTVASLEHPNVVRATDAGHQDGWHYLVMEYLDGLDVGKVAARVGRLEVADACEVVRQAALGLAHIHASGLVHRDIKPSNLMMTRDGGIKLLDLGLVLSGDDPLSVDDRLTTVGHLMGTLPYMAPEQLVDSREVDPRADIYALGATLYRLIAGKPPHHRHGGLAKTVMAITKEDAPPVDSVREDLDADLAKLITEMTSRDPKVRPVSGEEVARRLGPFCDDSQLGRLLRRALRSDDNDTPRASSLLSLQPSDSQGSRKRPTTRRRIVTAVLATTLLLMAGFLLKIATDRGDLVIRSNEDLSVAVKQGGKMIDRLQIHAGDENKLTLFKGTYEIEIENADGTLVLSENTITITRGDDATVEVMPASAKRIYQGNDLAQWMNLLQREEDPNTLGQIMGAVEVLTRDTDSRREAAKATLRTSRLWGGSSSSSPKPNSVGLVSESPSQHYMFHLIKIFPRYGSDGLEAIDVELDQGNLRSRKAAIWLFSMLTQGDQPLPPKLIEHAEKAVKALLAEEGSGYSTVQAQNEAIRLLIRDDREIVGQPWLEDHVRREVNKALDQWKDPTPSGYFGGRAYPWVLSESMMVAAVQMEARNRLTLDWNWVAAVILHPEYLGRSDRSVAVYDALAAKAPDLLRGAISTGLDKLVTTPGSALNPRTGPAGSFWDHSVWRPVFAVALKESVWSRALQTYVSLPATEATSRSALERLQRVRESMLHFKINPDHPEQPFESLDRAIETLQRRVKTD